MDKIKKVCDIFLKNPFILGAFFGAIACFFNLTILSNIITVIISSIIYTAKKGNIASVKETFIAIGSFIFVGLVLSLILTFINTDIKDILPALVSLVIWAFISFLGETLLFYVISLGITGSLTLSLNSKDEDIKHFALNFLKIFNYPHILILFIILFVILLKIIL